MISLRPITSRHFAVSATVCASLALLSGCGVFPGGASSPADSPEPTPTATPKPKPNANGLTFSATTDKETYRRGEPVVVTMTLHNDSKKAQEVKFSSGQSFDLTVYAQADTTNSVWRWSLDKMFAMMMRTETLAPGETRAYTEKWSQKDNAGVALPDGKYFLDAQLVGIDNAITAPRRVLILKNSDK